MSNDNPPSRKEERAEGHDNNAPKVPDSPAQSTADYGISITESRPTNPLFLSDSQPPPEEYGRDRYTSRQPWMSREEAIVDSQGSTSAVVVDGASLSPFEGQKPQAPIRPPVPEDAGPLVAHEVVISDSPEVVDEPEGEEESRPVARRYSVGSGVLVSLFALFAKGIPLILVMGGGYYTYSYFFGPIPMVEKVWRTSASIVGITPAPVETQSKVSKILQQTRDVVKANDQRVHFASALADQDLDLDTLSDPEAMDVAPQGAEAAHAQSLQGVSEKAKSTLARKWNSQLSPGASRSPARSANDAPRIQSIGVVEVATEVPPSSEFFIWVNRATISGVRVGEDTRVFINGMAMELGETIYHPLGITIDGLDLNDTVLVFSDHTGAKLGKRF